MSWESVIVWDKFGSIQKSNETRNEKKNDKLSKNILLSTASESSAGPPTPQKSKSRCSLPDLSKRQYAWCDVKELPCE
jgi:hypothetical protein